MAQQQNIQPRPKNDTIIRPANFAPDDRVLLIRVARAFEEGMSERDLYEITRSWWRVGRRREGADYGFTVYHGLVRAVYSIDGWERPAQALIDEDPKREGRWAFFGRRNSQYEERFLLTDVSGFFPVGAQNPIRYINC